MGTLRNLREILKGMKRKSSTPKLCPRCGSPKLKLSSSFDTYPRMYGLTPMQYICENCGYRGPIAMEIEKESH